jgi:C4-dicarboxylate-specific signal transduction histidine kinase
LADEDLVAAADVDALGTVSKSVAAELGSDLRFLGRGIRGGVTVEGGRLG